MDRKFFREQSDSSLVALVQCDGLAEAYDELVRRRYPQSLNRARSILGNQADAEDAVQDALIRGLVKLNQLRDPHKFAAWLDRIVVSTSLSRLRSRRPDLLDIDTLEASLVPANEIAAEDVAVAEEASAAVNSAIDQLPSKYRDPVRLFHIHGHSHRSIAGILGLPIGTVQSLVNRARGKLSAFLAPHAGSTFYAL